MTASTTKKQPAPPAAPAFELRKLGHRITTAWVWRTTEAGERHRVGLYVLEME